MSSTRSDGLDFRKARTLEALFRTIFDNPLFDYLCSKKRTDEWLGILRDLGIVRPQSHPNGRLLQSSSAASFLHWFRKTDPARDFDFFEDTDEGQDQGTASIEMGDNFAKCSEYPLAETETAPNAHGKIWWAIRHAILYWRTEDKLGDQTIEEEEGESSEAYYVLCGQFGQKLQGFFGTIVRSIRNAYWILETLLLDGDDANVVRQAARIDSLLRLVSDRLAELETLYKQLNERWADAVLVRNTRQPEMIPQSPLSPHFRRLWRDCEARLVEEHVQDRLRIISWFLKLEPDQHQRLRLMIQELTTRRANLAQMENHLLRCPTGNGREAKAILRKMGSMFALMTWGLEEEEEEGEDESQLKIKTSTVCENVDVILAKLKLSGCSNTEDWLAKFFLYLGLCVSNSANAIERVREDRGWKLTLRKGTNSEYGEKLRRLINRASDKKLGALIREIGGLGIVGIKRRPSLGYIPVYFRSRSDIDARTFMICAAHVVSQESEFKLRRNPNKPPFVPNFARMAKVIESFFLNLSFSKCTLSSRDLEQFAKRYHWYDEALSQDSPAADAAVSVASRALKLPVVECMEELDGCIDAEPAHLLIEELEVMWCVTQMYSREQCWVGGKLPDQHKNELVAQAKRIEEWFLDTLNAAAPSALRPVSILPPRPSPAEAAARPAAARPPAPKKQRRSGIREEEIVLREEPSGRRRRRRNHHQSQVAERGPGEPAAAANHERRRRARGRGGGVEERRNRQAKFRFKSKTPSMAAEEIRAEEARAKRAAAVVGRRRTRNPRVREEEGETSETVLIRYRTPSVEGLAYLLRDGAKYL